MRKSLVALLAVLLVGCSGPVIDDPVEEVTPDPKPTEVITVGPVDTRSPAPDADVVESHEGPIVRASAETIAPDPEIMATMECEPLSADTLAALHKAYGPPHMDPVQVLVGEGLAAGELWWIVVTDTNWDRAGGNNQWLTNQPGLTGEQGKWIGIGSQMRLPDGSWGSSFDGVHWDYERLVRGRAALTKAFECLGGAVPPKAVTDA